MYALRIKTAIRGAENEKGNQMSQVQTQDSERRCLLPVLWLPCGGRKKEEEKLYKEIKNVSFWDLMFEHDYYEKYKDYGNLKLLRSLTKKKA